MSLRPIICLTFASPIGPLLVAGTETHITHVVKDRESFLARHPGVAPSESHNLLQRATDEIRRFLSGTLVNFTLPLASRGTEFQNRVWQELQNIPYGQTSSYTEIADRIGKSNAFRAVANACGSNPLPLIVPCHRVVHKNNTMSGFAWGVEIKRFLLEMESTDLLRNTAA